MIGRFFGRLILVPLGVLLAVFAASGVLLTLGLERLTHAMTGDKAVDQSLDDLLTILRIMLQLVSGLTLLPALAIVVVGEVARIRSALYYVAGGGLALVAIPFLARIGSTAGTAAPTTAVWTVFATAGFAGGFVYWLIAGRSA